MLYEAVLPCPTISTYQQHQYVERMFDLLDEERVICRANGETPARDYIWCESDGMLFLRRAKPTHELPWRPIQVPCTGTMINFQLKARPRRHNYTRVRDSRDCLAWLARNANRLGLFIEDAEVEEVSKWIEKGQGFYLMASYFEGIAKVINPAQFEHGLIHGFGDSKAFGFGFMFFVRRGQHRAKYP